VTSGDRVDPLRPCAAALVVLAISVGVFLSLRGSAEFVLYGEEFHSLRHLEKPYGDLIRFYGVDGTGGALVLLQRAAVDVFGPGLFAFRFPAMLGAIGALLLMYPAGVRLVGRTPAAIATLALALNSAHVFYSRFGRTSALAVFLGLSFVYSLARAMDREGPKPIWYLASAVSAGLLSYAQLSAAAFAAIVALAAFGVLSFRDGTGWHRLWLFGAVAVAAGLCLALYLPAWEPLWRFIEFASEREDPSQIFPIDAVALLAGSRTAALVWLALAPLAGAWILFRKRGEAVVLVVAAFAMPFALLLTQPVGGVYATAQYLFVSLPFVTMLLAWAVAASVRALGGSRRFTGAAEFAAGVLLVAVSFAAGPLGFRHVDDGPFGASYLSLMPLPAFDEPWRGGSVFYDALAQGDDSLRIVEAPELVDQAVALYRNYYLRHRKAVAMGAVTEQIPVDPEGLHVPVALADSTSADYVILHVDVPRELERYWDFVYREQWHPEEGSDLAVFMDFHREFRVPPPPPLRQLERELQSRWGRPFYRDRDIVVWKLER
jgi:hypothetical protein